jgi:predicted exporter
MHTSSRESRYFAALLILCGALALYGGERWLIVLIPAAVTLWFVEAARSHTRRAGIDARVENGSVKTVGR